MTNLSGQPNCPNLSFTKLASKNAKLFDLRFGIFQKLTAFETNITKKESVYDCYLRTLLSPDVSFESICKKESSRYQMYLRKTFLI